VIQDKLIRLAVALRNYATQLKILTSVKAASIEVNTRTLPMFLERTIISDRWIITNVLFVCFTTDD
jgi:hypothetical protein